MIGRWVAAFLLTVATTCGFAGGSQTRPAAQDTLAKPDSVRAPNEVPPELLENLDLLMDLEILEFVDLFGDADITTLVPEMADTASASTKE